MHLNQPRIIPMIDTIRHYDSHGSKVIEIKNRSPKQEYQCENLQKLRLQSLTIKQTARNFILSEQSDKVQKENQWLLTKLVDIKNRKTNLKSLSPSSTQQKEKDDLHHNFQRSQKYFLQKVWKENNQIGERIISKKATISKAFFNGERSEKVESLKNNCLKYSFTEVEQQPMLRGVKYVEKKVQTSYQNSRSLSPIRSYMSKTGGIKIEQNTQSQFQKEKLVKKIAIKDFRLKKLPNENSNNVQTNKTQEQFNSEIIEVSFNEGDGSSSNKQDQLIIQKNNSLIEDKNTSNVSEGYNQNFSSQSINPTDKKNNSKNSEKYIQKNSNSIEKVNSTFTSQNNKSKIINSKEKLSSSQEKKSISISDKSNLNNSKTISKDNQKHVNQSSSSNQINDKNSKSSLNESQKNLKQNSIHSSKSNHKQSQLSSQIKNKTSNKSQYDEDFEKENNQSQLHSSKDSDKEMNIIQKISSNWIKENEIIVLKQVFQILNNQDEDQIIKQSQDLGRQSIISNKSQTKEQQSFSQIDQSIKKLQQNKSFEQDLLAQSFDNNSKSLNNSQNQIQKQNKSSIISIKNENSQQNMQQSLADEQTINNQNQNKNFIGEELQQFENNNSIAEINKSKVFENIVEEENQEKEEENQEKEIELETQENEEKVDEDQKNIEENQENNEESMEIQENQTIQQELKEDDKLQNQD